MMFVRNIAVNYSKLAFCKKKKEKTLEDYNKELEEYAKKINFERGVNTASTGVSIIGAAVDCGMRFATGDPISWPLMALRGVSVLTAGSKYKHLEKKYEKKKQELRKEYLRSQEKLKPVQILYVNNGSELIGPETQIPPSGLNLRTPPLLPPASSQGKTIKLDEGNNIPAYESFLPKIVHEKYSAPISVASERLSSPEITSGLESYYKRKHLLSLLKPAKTSYEPLVEDFISPEVQQQSQMPLSGYLQPQVQSTALQLLNAKRLMYD